MPYPKPPSGQLNALGLKAVGKTRLLLYNTLMQMTNDYEEVLVNGEPDCLIGCIGSIGVGLNLTAALEIAPRDR